MSSFLRHGSLYAQFAARRADQPESPAVSDARESLSYAELDQLAGRIAAGLRDAGISHGDLVAVDAAASAGHIALLLGIMRTGAAWLPLDTSWPEQRRTKVLAAARPALCVGEAFIADCSDSDAEMPPAELSASDLCYVMFTSGSTGEPLEVRVSHGNVAGLTSGLPEALRPDRTDCWSALHASTFGFSLWESFGALTSGGQLCVVPAEQRRDPVRWSDTIAAAGVTVLSLTPSGLAQWLAAGIAMPVCIDRVVLSGEPVGRPLLDAWFKAGESRPSLFSTYGLTETAGRVAWLRIRSQDDAGLLGQPTPDAQLLLLDPTHHKPVAAGEIGELHVVGAMVADERFATGDQARLRPDGVFEFAGRADTQLKLRGHRIEPGDIEAALQADPAVGAAAVVQSADPSPQLHAFVVPAGADGGGVEFWPSLGEYQIYDALLYDFMSADEQRVAAYRRALERSVSGKVALDIGTGKDAILARLCAHAGARHVYAVEVLESAAAAATQLIAELGLQEKITVICGDMDTVELPEPIDVCTQGIVGNIGSSDGIVPIWNRASRLFASPYRAVPELCTTLIAPVRLPDEAREAPAFGSLAADYTRRVFAAENREFDVRLCVRNFPTDALLTEPAVFEELDFHNSPSADYQGCAEFLVSSSGWCDGYVLWTRLTVDAQDSVDFLEHQQAWLPVFFPLGDEPAWLEEGARLESRWQCTTDQGQVFPDYQISTRVTQPDGAVTEYRYQTRHHEHALGSTGLHRKLLASLELTQSLTDTEALLAGLREQLPEYMVPATISLLPALPLNSSNKLDRRVLQGMALERTASPLLAETDDPLETAMLAIWSEALGRPVGPDDDFFAVGGDSITAVRLTTEVQRFLDDAVFLAGLYEAPDVRRYCVWLREHHPQAVAAVGDSAPGDAELIALRDGGPSPLSWSQQSLWFLQQLYPDNTAANEQFVIRIRGVSPQRIIDAWAAVVSRHDVLRTRFIVDNGTPLQQVDDMSSDAGQRAALLGDVIDLRCREDSAAELMRLAQEQIVVAFDLQHDRLLRPVLVRLTEDDTALLVTAHHIVADGLCVPLIRDELAAAVSGAPQSEPELKFSDYAVWQRRQVQGDWLNDELNWWRDHLDGVVMTPVESTQPQVDASGPEVRIPFVFDRQVSRQLRALAHQEGVSLFTALLAIWRIWLGRCFGRNDFLLGSPATQRTTAQTAGLLGCMVNNVAFRNPLDWQQGFREALRAEHAGQLAALDHSAVPFEKIVEDLQPERVFGRHPLFQFMFQYEERPAPLQVAGGEEFAVDVLPVDRSSYWDMELSVTDAGGDEPLAAFLGVRSDLFDSTAVAEWSAGLTALLGAALDDPSRALADLPLLNDEQRDRRERVNQTAYRVPDKSLFELFASQAAQCPEKTAVRVAGDRYSYAELLDQVERYSRALHASGVGERGIVGVAVPRSFAAVALLLAINSRGAAWVALDPDYPAERLRNMLDDLTPQLVVHGEGALAPDVETLLHDTGVPLVSTQALAERALSVRDMHVMPPPEHSCVLFTSGSTGLPKGVYQAHAHTVSRCLWMWGEWGFSVDEIFAHRTSLNFVDAVWEIFGPLLHGATIEVMPQEWQRDISAQSRFIADRDISHVVLFPSALSMMLNQWSAQAPKALRTVITTGEPIPPALVQRFREVLPQSRLLNTYGTSENWDISCARLDDCGDALVGIGKPVANASVHVLDAFMQPLPAGAPGDLYVGGSGVGDGYIDRPELTAERYVGNLFRTGDRASFTAHEGLRLHGRADRQLKLRGVRIEPGEIEVIVTARSDIAEAAVVLHGETAESAWLTLYIVPADGALIDDDELRIMLSQRLPTATVPAEIVQLDAIPVTPSGKVDTAALQGIAASRSDVIAPATETEATLLSIWEQSLDSTGFGTRDNFFALRGNSLLATQVIARICDEFGLDLPLASLFEAPTVHELGRVVDAMLWATGKATASDGDEEREVLRL